MTSGKACRSAPVHGQWERSATDEPEQRGRARSRPGAPRRRTRRPRGRSRERRGSWPSAGPIRQQTGDRRGDQHPDGDRRADVATAAARIGSFRLPRRLAARCSGRFAARLASVRVRRIRRPPRPSRRRQCRPRRRTHSPVRPSSERSRCSRGRRPSPPRLRRRRPRRSLAAPRSCPRIARVGRLACSSTRPAPPARASLASPGSLASLAASSPTLVCSMVLGSSSAVESWKSSASGTEAQSGAGVSWVSSWRELATRRRTGHAFFGLFVEVMEREELVVGGPSLGILECTDPARVVVREIGDVAVWSSSQASSASRQRGDDDANDDHASRSSSLSSSSGSPSPISTGGTSPVGRLGPVRQLDRTGDRVGRGLHRRALDAGGVRAGVEREAQRRAGPHRRWRAAGRRSGADRRLAAGVTSPRSMASAASSAPMIRTPSVGSAGRPAGGASSSSGGSSNCSIHACLLDAVPAPRRLVSPGAVPALCSRAPGRSRLPGRG